MEETIKARILRTMAHIKSSAKMGGIEPFRIKSIDFLERTISCDNVYEMALVLEKELKVEPIYGEDKEEVRLYRIGFQLDEDFRVYELLFPSEWKAIKPTLEQEMEKSDE